MATLLTGLQGIVQYRRKASPSPWMTMAAFDQHSVADHYCDQQRKDEDWPWEYRSVEIDPDTGEAVEAKPESSL